MSDNDARAQFLARFDEKVVRLDDQLAEFIRLISHQLAGLKTEMAAGMGYKAMVADATFLRKLKDLGATLNSATDAQIRLDKTADERAKKLTPEKELAAVRTFIRSMKTADRGLFLGDEVLWHNKQGGRLTVRPDGE